MTTKVKLYTKPITGNRQAYYLDFYPAIKHPITGKITRRKVLGLYIHNEIEYAEQTYIDKNGNPKTRLIPSLNRKGEQKKIRLNPLEKSNNYNTTLIAEQLRQKWDNQLNKPEVYNGFEKEQLKIKEKGEQSFIDYFKKMALSKNEANKENWLASLNYLIKFAGAEIKFCDLDEKFCNEFRDFLLKSPSIKSKKATLTQNSASSYYDKIKTALKESYKEGYLPFDINVRMKPIKITEVRRNFVTLDQLNVLAKTDCPLPILKKAALFSALTGLRFSDIENLKWGEIECSGTHGYVINFKQKKTKGIETLPISKQAYSLLGDAKTPSEKVFDGLEYSWWVNKQLKIWLKRAGIADKITFHCFRHTFAVLQIELGTDIFTVSKMLGHRELRTTQVYAKVRDKAKREAADRIQLTF